MVAQITVPKSIKRALNYNEKKVQQGKAELILAQNFLKLPGELSFYNKLHRFENQMELNERAQTKTIHISLNFPPEEKEKMTKEFLITLADEYMDRIGFGKQPYLVYQHHDSAHPHVHVVSTLIKEDGSRINTHHLGKDVSEPARKEMEIKYGLISSNKREFSLKQEKELSITPQRVLAGKSEVQRSITNVLDHVVNKYKYTSLNELNAVLKLYNVRADRGVEGGRIHSFKGLTYAVVDMDGKVITKPIKASAIHSKPTLALIEKKAEENAWLREPYKQKLKTAIEWSFRSKPTSFTELANQLKRDKISLVVRCSEKGQVYGLTYIDHNYKTVFNGSDLGKEYSAKRIIERLNEQSILNMEKEHELRHKSKEHSKEQPKENTLGNETGKAIGKIIEHVVDPSDGMNDTVNRELINEKKHRRKKNRDMGMEM